MPWTDFISGGAKPRLYQGEDRIVINYPADTVAQMWVGAALMKDPSSGRAVPCSPTPSGQFLGFAEEWIWNLVGGVYEGKGEVPITMRGLVWLTVAASSTFARSDVGTTVYASDVDTFTQSAGTNNIVIGKIVKIPNTIIGASSGDVLVAFEAYDLRSL